MTTLWPSMTDYSGAVQNASGSFRLPALANAEFATMPPLGLPAFASGQNAVVFSATMGQATTAVRCFTSPSAEGRRRYQALERRLKERPVASMASAQWIDDAIEVNGRTWPIVTMEWVDGQQLHEWVEDHLHDAAALGRLSDDWIRACSSLRGAEVGHGDLQHGNVMVDRLGAVRLIDFDGVWVDEIDDAPPSEVGHPNYQHPARSETGGWGWSIDWFASLAVLVSLKALAADPALWDHHNGENLIFRESDFWGDAEIWRALERSADRDVAELSGLLAEGCGHPCDAPFDLPTILSDGLIAVDAPAGIGERRRSSPNPPPREATSTPPPPGESWWAGAAPTADEPQAPMPRPDSRPFEPGVVNASWATGTGASSTTSSPGASSSGAGHGRPPERERPAAGDVRSNWNDPPPHPASTPPPPNAGGGPSSSSMSTGPTASQGPAPRGGQERSVGTVLSYIALIVIFLAIGYLFGVAGNGGG